MDQVESMFRVQFMGPTSGAAISKGCVESGRLLFEEARAVFGDRIVRVYWEQQPHDDPCVTLTKTEAAEAGHFEDQGEIIVHVPAGYLNACVDRVFRLRDGTGATEAELLYVLNERLVIDSWLFDGAPLYWSCTKESWSEMSTSLTKGGESHI